MQNRTPRQVLAIQISTAFRNAAPPLDRIERFIHVVGFPDVQAAFDTTRKRFQAHQGQPHPVADPWTYMLAVVNGGPARCQYVYLLLNLWERSLRNRIDLIYTAERGNQWFRNPKDYLPSTAVAELEQQHIKGKFFASAEKGSSVHSRFTRGLQYVGALYLPELHAILQAGWTTSFMSGMTHAVDGRVTYNKLSLHLNDAYQARTEVMHARDMSNAVFRQSIDATRYLLELIGYDVDKALSHIADRDPHEEDLNLFTTPRPAPRPTAAAATQSSTVLAAATTPASIPQSVPHAQPDSRRKQTEVPQ